MAGIRDCKECGEHVLNCKCTRHGYICTTDGCGPITSKSDDWDLCDPWSEDKDDCEACQ